MPFAQTPQLRTPPQPFPIVPQYWPPIGVHVTATQFGSLQTLGVLRPQLPPFGQVPQSSVPPHPSPIGPQKRVPPALLQVSGTQPGEAQMPELHCWPAPQVVQVRAWPQPSPIVPQ
jgi:hypothetical protein